MAVDGSQRAMESAQDQQVARDDAHLRSLGIKPELQRTLGFLSNFAVAFSYISVSTGTFTLIGLGLAVGGPSFFWSWPIIIVGQLFVALNFAELASHFPVAGSIYQWSKRLSNRTLGLFTGWIYFWAGVLTVTAVAATVASRLSSISASPLPSVPDRRRDDLSSSRLLTLIIDDADQRLRRQTAVDHQQPRRRRRDPRDARLRPDPAVLLQSPVAVGAVHTGGAEKRPGGSFPPVFLLGMFMALFVVYGFDTAGTFGEETIDAGRQAPRGVLAAILISGAVGAVFILPMILACQDVAARSGAPGRSASRSRDITGDLTADLVGGIPRRDLPVRDPGAVFVCTLAIQGATTRLMFSMGRDRRLPFGVVWGTSTRPSRRRPTQRSRWGSSRPSRPAHQPGPAVLAIAATGLIYLSYFLCNLGVLMARRKGWPHKPRVVQPGQLGHDGQHPGPRLGRRDDLEHRLWQDQGLFGDFGGWTGAGVRPTRPSRPSSRRSGNKFEWPAADGRRSRRSSP